MVGKKGLSTKPVRVLADLDLWMTGLSRHSAAVRTAVVNRQIDGMRIAVLGPLKNPIQRSHAEPLEQAQARHGVPSRIVWHINHTSRAFLPIGQR